MEPFGKSVLLGIGFGQLTMRIVVVVLDDNHFFLKLKLMDR